MSAADEQARRTLRDLLDFGEAAHRLVARGRSAYEEDEMLRLAAEALVHKIGEATNRLPKELIDAHPHVPWRAMKGTRNVVAHQYEIVDYDLLWTALHDRLPRDVVAIRGILEGPSSPR